MKERSALPQRILSVISILGLALAFTTIKSPVGAAQEAAASDQEAAEQPYTDDGIESLPLSPVEKAEKDGTAVYLSLKEITRLALQNNIDIAIEDTNEEAARLNLVSAEASYDPSLSGRFSLDSSRRANTLSYEESEGDFATTKQYNWSTTFSQPVKTGGTFSASYTGSRISSDSSARNFNPEYSARGSIEFKQPLWKNLSIDQNRGQIKIRKLDMETSDLDFKQTVTARISQIEQAYWDLVSAIQDYAIQRDSLKLAMINLRDNRKRVEVGTQAPITIVESEYQVAQRRQNLTSAEERIVQQMNNMRQYVSNDKDNEIWSKVIVPTDSPEFQEYLIDLETAIEIALENSPDLHKNSLELEKADINLRMNANNKKWGLDLTASFNNSGNAGEPTGDPSDPFYRPPPEDQIGGFGRAFQNMFSSGLYGWSLQLNVDIPIRNRSAEAAYANQVITKKRTILNRKKMEQQVVVEIRNAYQALQTSRQQVETAELGKRLAQEQLDGEEKRYDAGLTENYRVLEQQENLAQAENTELSRLISYKKNIIALQEAMQTLLEESDYEISKSASENIPDLY
ncbi:MAG: TolC family protein [Acidobacteria bacterium]|nr:TolC family protein [Acidobacteriota bacterium]